MPIQQHPQVSSGRGVHHPVHDLQRGQPLQIRVEPGVDAGDRRRRYRPGIPTRTAAEWC